MKRLICTLVALAFCVALAAGCGENRGQVDKSHVVDTLPSKGPIAADSGGPAANAQLQRPKGK